MFSGGAKLKELVSMQYKTQKTQIMPGQYLHGLHIKEYSSNLNHLNANLKNKIARFSERRPDLLIHARLLQNLRR